jgi:hypothetical protein
MICDNCGDQLDSTTLSNVSTFSYSNGSVEFGYCLCVVCAGKIKRLLDGGKL